MNSCLYECHVLHQRFSPKPHRLLYRLLLTALDLDELPDVQRHLRLFSINGRNLYSFHERDYLPTAEPLHPAGKCNQSGYISTNNAPEPRPEGNPTGSASALKARVLAHLAAHGVSLPADTRVVLVSLPRVLGYLFNPVVFYFCFDRSTGEPRAALAEVTNTFREVKPFVLGPDRLQTQANARGQFRLRIPKNFYVSPFSDVDLEFDFILRPPGEKLSIQIDDYTGDTRTLTSTLTGPRRELTDARLAWFLLKYPLLTLRVIFLIHWNAFLLWAKKTPWFAKAARADFQRDLYRPHVSIRSSKS